MSTKQLPTLLGTTSGASALIDTCLSQPGLTWFSTSADFSALQPLCLFPCHGSREVWQRVHCVPAQHNAVLFLRTATPDLFCVWVIGTLWLQHECMMLKHLRLSKRRLDFLWYLFCNLQHGMKSVVLPARLDQFGFNTERDSSYINSLFKTEAL